MEYQLLNFVSFSNLTNWSAFTLLRKELGFNDSFPFYPIGEFLRPIRRSMNIEDNIIYRRLTVRTRNGGIAQRDLVLGNTIGTKKQFWVKTGDFIISRIDARNGAFGLVPDDLNDSVVTNDFPVFKVDNNKILSQFLVLIATTEQFIRFAQSCSSGTTNRQRIDVAEFMKKEIPLPNLSVQKEIIENYNNKMQEAIDVENDALKQFDIFQEKLIGLLEIEIPKKVERIKNVLYFENLANLKRWDVWNSNDLPYSKIYDNVEFNKIISTGPMYGANTKSAETNSDIRYLRITDINEDGSLNNEIVQAKDEDAKYLLEENDFLIARSGNTVGKSFLYKSKFGKCLFAGYLVKYKLNTEKVLPEYVFAYTKGIIFKEWIKSNQRISGQPNINGQEYMKAPFILPNKSVQLKVVEEFKLRTENYYSLKEQSKKLKEQAIKDFEAKIFKN